MKLTIGKAGLFSTIQDIGRLRYLSQAVPFSGAMDNLSARIANAALGNDEGCALIEFTQSGASFFTEGDVLLALSGDGAFLSTGEGRLPSDRPVFIPAGTKLYLENSRLGCRSYLAVAGGWDVPKVLGSRSTYLTAKIGGINGRCIKDGEQLSNTGRLSCLSEAILNGLTGETIKYAHWSVARNMFLQPDRKTIRVMKGREFKWFDACSTEEFLSQTFNVGHNNNRMGCHLHGPIMKRAIEGELLSTAVMPGTIQVTGGGNLILLMADSQTTGGYPRIAQVAAVDLPMCAQLNPGDTISFKEISWKEAEMLYIQHELDLHKLGFGIRQKYNLI